ncbi:MAG TPA: TolC family protein [Candidatus Limnocylindrales bacterium]|nr:TolC family protein [Candidatus Limnocylindrales bacterium]
MKKIWDSRWLGLPVVMLLASGAAGACSTAVGTSSGIATNTLSLEEAVRISLESNPELRASGARVEAAAGRAHQAGKWTNPELELKAEDWPVSNGHGFSDAKQTIGIIQTLPYPGKKSLDKRIGGAGVKFSEAELALRRTEVVRDVKAGFYRVLATERLVEVSRELVSVAESSAATARKRVDAGAAAYQEQLRAEVQLEQARTELADFERDLATVRQAFATVLGRPDLRDANLSGALADAPDSTLTEARAESMLDRHPSTAAARTEVAKADLEQRRARLDPYPDVQVGMSGGRIGETDQSIIQLGFALPLPILDTGKGKKEEAKANVAVAEAELTRVQQALQREWANAQKRYRTAIEQVASYRDRLLPKATEALRLVRTGFEEGKFGFIDLLDTQRTTAEARLAYQQKLLEMNIAQAELEALLRP